MTRWDGINRTEVIVIRVSPKEKQRFEQAAARAKLPVGTWVRTKCIGQQQGRRP